MDTGQLNRSDGEIWMVPVRFCVLLLINLMLVPLTNTPDEFLFSLLFFKSIWLSPRDVSGEGSLIS